MPRSQEDIIRRFFGYLSQSNYDKAKDFMVILKVLLPIYNLKNIVWYFFF